MKYALCIIILPSLHSDRAPGSFTNTTECILVLRGNKCVKPEMSNEFYMTGGCLAGQSTFIFALKPVVYLAAYHLLDPAIINSSFPLLTDIFLALYTFSSLPLFS